MWEQWNGWLDRAIDWMALGGIAVFAGLDVVIVIEMLRLLRSLP